jgi:transposase
MKAYSEDLRVRVLGAVDGGLARAVAARVYAVSVPSIKRWLRLRRETGAVTARPVPGPAPVKRGPLLAALPARLADAADATLEQHCAWWREASGVAVSTATMSRAIAEPGWTRKERR